METPMPYCATPGRRPAAPPRGGAGAPVPTDHPRTPLTRAPAPGTTETPPSLADQHPSPRGGPDAPAPTDHPRTPLTRAPAPGTAETPPSVAGRRRAGSLPRLAARLPDAARDGRGFSDSRSDRTGSHGL
ncbi:hypothetical protein Airi02_055190 [Actinoallomurus iriomotensis]|uniref:Uncharacterized protein n=1 Tax=Actinoallomurus iriomotensis TaxID=478107 RepID=A0A9W6W166_9ACTN|nr:hypothetical protein Airi02_055190 [Actinoallomurus iriomotensis]